MPDLEDLRLWVHVCLVVAAVSTTTFPMLYCFSPWSASGLGRVLMLQGIAFAAAMDLTAIFSFWAPIHHIELALIINAVVFTFIAASTGALTIMLWRLQHERANNNIPKRRFDD